MLIPRKLPRGADRPRQDLVRGGSIAYWERYALAHPELDENTNVGCARPGIDHGRLLTLERREKLTQLEAVLIHDEDSMWETEYRIDNRALLSPRRIYRSLLNGEWGSRAAARAACEVADKLYALIRDWVESGYPTPEHPADLGMPPRTIYKAQTGNRAINIYLTWKA